MSYPLSDHFDGTRFFNPGVDNRKGLLMVLKWKLQGNRTPWPKRVVDRVPSRAGLPLPADTLRVTYVNHATLLVEMPGLTFLTDPIFSKRASPLAWAGPTRVRAPGVDFKALPKIDAVLVSHNHYDHLDLPTLRRLVQAHDPKIFAPLGNRALLQKSGSNRVVELDWWQTDEAVTAVPVLHWSKRGAFDDNRALWCGFVVRFGGFQIYFSGDTGYTPFFAETAQRLGPCDVALLPIGAYKPRWFMNTVHMDPQASVQAHLDLKARHSIGMHYGTFQLTDEGIDEPITELAQARVAKQIAADAFRAPRHGESFEFGRA